MIKEIPTWYWLVPLAGWVFAGYLTFENNTNRKEADRA